MKPLFPCPPATCPNLCDSKCCQSGGCPRTACGDSPDGTSICNSDDLTRSTVNICIKGEWKTVSCFTGSYCPSQGTRRVEKPTSAPTPTPTPTPTLTPVPECPENCRNSVDCASCGLGWECVYGVCLRVGSSCPVDSRQVGVPNAEKRLLGKPSECAKPTMLIIHWSGNWGSVETTYNSLEKEKLSCEFAVDVNRTLQMQRFFSDTEEVGACAGKGYNVNSINIEIAGAYFDDIINNPSHSQYLQLKTATARAVDVACWVLDKYKIKET